MNRSLDPPRIVASSASSVVLTSAGVSAALVCTFSSSRLAGDVFAGVSKAYLMTASKPGRPNSATASTFRHAIPQTLALLTLAALPLAPEPDECEIPRLVDLTDREHAGFGPFVNFEGDQSPVIICLIDGVQEIATPCGHKTIRCRRQGRFSPSCFICHE